MIERELRATIQTLPHQMFLARFRSVNLFASPDRSGGTAGTPDGYEGTMLRDDYVIRLIKQLGRFLARIARKRKDEEYEAAIAEAGNAWDEMIGHSRSLVDVVDMHTLAGILIDPVRMRAAAQLLIEEGRAYAGNRDPVHAATCYRHAWELYLEARVLEPLDDDAGVMTELARLVPANQLDARYRIDV